MSKRIPTTKQIAEIVKRQLVSHLGLDKEPLHTDNIEDDLGADSLDMVELIMTFEECFNIDIPDDAVEDVKTVQDIIKYIGGTVCQI